MNPDPTVPDTWEQLQGVRQRDLYWRDVYRTALQIITAGGHMGLMIETPDGVHPVLYMHDVFQIVELYRRRFGVDIRLPEPGTLH